MAETEKQTDDATLTVQLLSAYLANNSVASEDLAGLIRTTRAALVEDTAPVAVEPEVPTYTPAVSVRKSLASLDYIISLLDGKPYKTLKRHLSANGLTPDQYRERFSLPASYPMVAPSFAARRREIAEQIGLGNKRSARGPQVAEVNETSDTVNTPANDEALAKPPRGRSAGKRAAGKASAGDAGSTKASGHEPESSSKAGASQAVTDTNPAERGAEPVAAPEVQVTDDNELPAPIKASKRPAAVKRTEAVSKPAGKGNPAAKPRAPSLAKATETVTNEVNTDEAPAAATKRRGKLGLFGKAAGQGRGPEPTEAGAATLKKPVAKKRMARASKSTPSKPTVDETASE